MHKKLIQVAAVAVLLVFPFIVHFLYVQMTALPDEIVLATGPVDGRYHEFSRAIKDELLRRHPGMIVTLKETDGSLQNLQLLQSGEVDFALYQSDTESILKSGPIAEHDFGIGVCVERLFRSRPLYPTFPI